MGCNALDACVRDGGVDIVSGGDDQAMTRCRLRCDAVGSSVVIAVLALERHASATGSAIKGIALLSGGRRVVSVGYDQRLNLWRLPEANAEPAPLLDGDTTGAIRPREGAFVWESGVLVNIGDIEGLVLAANDPRDEAVRLLVMGQGFRYFDYQLCSSSI